ncbi:MAG: flagellar biosynthetic protein FliR [Buchnera aphidicola (Periphyllus acericola)]|uniref:flagellar biosynthetic protein FliR n=1 Tax=Buchnera aphidicola TaxID=9 RepID=UPI0030CDB56A|nr:flagellar biosynthetic protein FliR [Buchnera aphidicola (Periphyllus acericola)]
MTNLINYNFTNCFIVFKNIFYLSIRIFFLFYTAPVFNSIYFNIKMKILLSIIISLVIFQSFPILNFSIFSLTGEYILFKQILIGILLGFSINLIFFITNISGEIFSFQTSLSILNFFDESVMLRSSVMSHLLNILLILLFLSLDGHLWVLSTIIQSFYFFPMNFNFLNIKIFFSIIKFFNLIFISGIHLILPIIIILFCMNIYLCFLNKFTPQLSIFSIGFSIINFIGLLSFFVFLFPIFFFLNNYLNKIYLSILNIYFK